MKNNQVKEEVGNFEQVESLTDAVRLFFEQLAEVLNEAVVVLTDGFERLFDSVRTVYCSEGAVYGDDFEGLMRWVGEKMEQARADEAAEKKALQEWAGRLE